ncbi:hypothetical protein F4810DRAFT_710840 [Camillea tinctor]|nr:hypothetical protein F4810DRAFT_710840 [Camillea tinctor]
MSSSTLSSGNAPAQRVPAWKRLGLKLKPASEEQGQHFAAPHNSSTSTPAPAGVRNVKRKSPGAPALEQSAKRAKQDNSQGRSSTQAAPPKRPKAKSVSFTADTAAAAAETRPPARANGTTRPAKRPSKPSPKKAVAPPAKPIKQAPVNLEPALTYLRLWHTSRESWKFNKNHQTKLLEQVFADETTIPAADISVFYEYISGLKGAVRTRLRELANGVRARDLEQGADGFPGAKEGSKAMAEKKQAEYEAVVGGFLGKERTPEKRRFEEVEYVLRTADMEMQRRVVKRMRAETVLDELASSEDAAAPEKGESSSKDAQSAANQAAAGEGPEGDKRLKLNDGSQQRVKRKRKLRTATVEDDTSSESDSDSDSESDSDSSSSSSSSSDSEDEGAAALGTARNEADSSSSSSSSSSESSESESDSDSSEDDDD